MAFVFFTRATEAVVAEATPAAEPRTEVRSQDGWSRLAALAAEGEEP